MFLYLYLVSLPLNLISTGSLLEQNSLGLVIVTAVHAGVVAALFWALLANAIVATQIVEDATPGSLVVSSQFISILLLIHSRYSLYIRSYSPFLQLRYTYP